MILASRPSIRRRDMNSVLTCMVSDSLGPGALTEQLVGAVSEYLGLSGGIAVRERGRALAMTIRELDLPAGTPVLMDPLLPFAYDAVVRETGCVPRYVDVRSDCACIDVDSVSRSAEGAGAVLVESRLGFVPDLDGLAELGLPIIEDVSCGIGANAPERRVGTYGRYVLVSMEPDHLVTAGGGTLVLTAGKRERASLRRRVESCASDVLLPDMNAALGLTQIRELERYVARRAELAGVFARALMRTRHRALVQPGDAQNVHYTFPILVEGSVQEITSYARKKGVEALLTFADSIIARFGSRHGDRHLASSPDDAHREDAHREEAAGAVGTPGDDPGADGGSSAGDGTAGEPEPGHTVLAEADFPNARAFRLRCVSFPLYPSLTAKEVAAIERLLTTLP